MLSLALLVVNTADDNAYRAVTESFAAFAAVTGIVASYYAFLVLVLGNEWEVGHAVDLGVAIGFLPGLATGVLIFNDVFWNVPHK